MTDIKRKVCGDRISVYQYQTNAFKSENISIYFALPEKKDMNVLRSLLLSVLKRGTEKYPTQKHINERLDELYATLVNLKNQKFDNVQLLGVSADFIGAPYTEDSSDLLPDILEVISQMLFSPRLDEHTGMFREEFVRSEKDNYKSIILSQINEPRTYAAIRCREEMFKSLGSVDKLDTMCEKIDSATVSELWECYCDMIANAEVIVFYIGERSIDEIYSCVEKIVPRFKDNVSLCKSEKKIKILDNLNEPDVIIESSDISQGRLVMGYNCGVTWRDDEYYAMLLCNEILGSSPISKLMTNVREKLSLCYECSSVYNSARGAIFVTTGIDCENYDLASDAISQQIEDIKNGKISEQEFLAAKKSIYNIYSAVADSASAIERFYLGRIINNIDVDIREFLNKMEDVSLADVVVAANKLSAHTIYFLRGDECEGEDDLYE